MAMPCSDREDVEDSGDVQRGRLPKGDKGGVRPRLPTKNAGYRSMTRQDGGGAAGLNVTAAESRRRPPVDYPDGPFRGRNHGCAAVGTESGAEATSARGALHES
jgi:hypothetical protein